MHGGYCCFLGIMWWSLIHKMLPRVFLQWDIDKISSGSTKPFKKRKYFLPNFFTLSLPLHNNRLRESKFSLKYKTGLLLRDIACTQTLFYFSFRCLRKDRRARDRSKRARARASAERGARERKNNSFFFPHPYPLALVNKSAPDLFFITTAQRTLKRK